MKITNVDRLRQTYKNINKDLIDRVNYVIDMLKRIGIISITLSYNSNTESVILTLVSDINDHRIEIECYDMEFLIIFADTKIRDRNSYFCAYKDLHIQLEYIHNFLYGVL
jgi:hypothetical protein